MHSRILISMGLVATVLASCGPSGFDSGPAPFRTVKTEPLPDSRITLEGEEYVLKRNRLLDGPNAGGEGWAIIVDGRTFRCAEPNAEWCLKALRAAQAGARDEGGGMY